MENESKTISQLTEVVQRKPENTVGYMAHVVGRIEEFARGYQVSVEVENHDIVLSSAGGQAKATFTIAFGQATVP